MRSRTEDGAERGERRASTARRGGQARSAVPLERYTTYASTAGQRGVSAAQLRALDELQEVGYSRAGLLTRVKECGEHPIVNGQCALGVTERGGTQVCGMARCGSRWCPHCWGLVSETRTAEITQVARWAETAGHKLVLATLTAAHVQGSVLEECGGDLRKALMQQSVTELFDGLASAWRFMHSGRGGQALKDDRVGYARAFELTTDSVHATVKSGVHGHFHVLLVLDEDANVELYRERFWSRWSAGCARSDLMTDRGAFDWKILEVGDKSNIQSAASYLVKGEKRDAKKIGLELTRSDVKGGKIRVSPEGLLRSIGAMEEDDQKLSQAIAMWRGIESACRGRRWLTWSRDLRRLAGLGEERTDEEIALADHEVEDGKLLVVRWKEVRDHLDEIRKIVYESPAKERWGVLELLLVSYGIEYRETTQEKWRARVAEFMRRLGAHRRGERE